MWIVKVPVGGYPHKVIIPLKKNGSITCNENGIAEVYDENVIKELKEMEVFINYTIEERGE